MTSVGPIIQPTRQPGHGVGLGHAVDHDAAVGQLGHHHRHRVVLGAAVDQVLVDLVGDDPDAVLDRPAADGLDLVPAGTRRPSGWTARRRAAPWCAGVRAASSWSTVTRNPLDASVGHDHRHTAGQGDRLGVGRPVRGGHQHLVARVAQGGEGVGDGLLAAVGDQHLGRGHLVAGVTRPSWRRWRRGARAARRSACTGGSSGRGRRPPRPPRWRRGREVRLTGAEADDVSPWAWSALALASMARVADGETAAIRAEMRLPVTPAPRGLRSRFLSAGP